MISDATGIKTKVFGVGSGKGLLALLAGKSDVAITSNNLEGTIKSAQKVLKKEGKPAIDIPENLRLTDDIWLSGILEANGVGIWVDARHALRRSTFTGQVDALQHITEAGNDRRTANARCITYMRENFGIWL